MNDKTQPISTPATGNSASETLKRKRSPVTLNGYVAVLRKASVEVLPLIHTLSQEEQRVVTELLDAGLLSDARKVFGNGLFVSTDVIILTPAGANALLEWSDFLKRESWWYKVGDSVLRSMWILLGALCALLPDIIRSF